MSFLINLGIIIVCAFGVVISSFYIMWRLQRKRIMQAIENANTPEIKTNATQIMKPEQVQQMIDEINRRIAEEKDQISPELMKAMFELRKKFQNALNEMKKDQNNG